MELTTFTVLQMNSLCHLVLGLGSRHVKFPVRLRKTSIHTLLFPPPSPVTPILPIRRQLQSAYDLINHPYPGVGEREEQHELGADPSDSSSFQTAQLQIMPETNLLPGAPGSAARQVAAPTRSSPVSSITSKFYNHEAKFEDYSSVLVSAAVGVFTLGESDSDDSTKADGQNSVVSSVVVEDDRQEIEVRREADSQNNVVTNESTSSASLKRKIPSPVWEFAEKVDGKAKCKICQLCFVCPHGNTSNITNHILNKHRHSEEAMKLKALIDEKDKAKKIKAEKAEKLVKANASQTNIASFFTKSTPLSQKAKDDIDDSLVEFLICENKSFETVESHFFRKLLFATNRSYTIPSRRTITRKIDEKITNVKKDLKAEINVDIAVHKSIAITSDGGNSGDINKTKKNSLTVSRITEDFHMKTDIVSVPQAKGSQEGVVIRRQWKEELLKIGYTDDWKVNVTTDGASNFRSARASGRHEEVGLPTNYTSDCVDHQIHLLVEESIMKLPAMKNALKNGKSLVTHFSRSSLSRQLLRSIQEDLGVPKLCPIIGTSNRWYHKMTSIERLLEIRDSVEVFQQRSTAENRDDDEENEAFEAFTENEWKLMRMYVTAVNGFQVLSKFFGGSKYPAATSVIPALDQIKEDLENLKSKFGDNTEGKELVTYMLKSLDKRFPNCWRSKSPFNCLTYLDPRYIDMYADTEDVIAKIKEDIKNDSAYDLIGAGDAPTVSVELAVPSTSTGVDPPISNPPTLNLSAGAETTSPGTSAASSSGPVASSSNSASSSLPSRRAALLAKKHLVPEASAPVTFETKFNDEIEKYVSYFNSIH